MENLVENSLQAATGSFGAPSLFFEYQFGFCPSRSTELAVTYFTDLIRKEADSGKATGAVFIDLSKAFDTISHSVLLRKVSRCDVYDMEVQGLLIIYCFVSRSFSLVVRFLNQILFTQEFLKEAFWGLSFF